jgi:hypothetical protein
MTGTDAADSLATLLDEVADISDSYEGPITPTLLNALTHSRVAIEKLAERLGAKR